MVWNLTKKFGIWQGDSLKCDPQVEYPLKDEPDAVDLYQVGCASDASGTAVLEGNFLKNEFKCSIS